MSFWEALTLVGVVATILGVSLTLYALINNNTLKKESKLTRESIIEIIKEESRLTREFLAEILDRIDKRAEERHRDLLSKF